MCVSRKIESRRERRKKGNEKGKVARRDDGADGGAMGALRALKMRQRDKGGRQAGEKGDVEMAKVDGRGRPRDSLCKTLLTITTGESVRVTLGMQPRECT